MDIPSLLRFEEHKALVQITLSGRVLDLGGDKNSEYLRFFKGTFETTTLNLSSKTRPDIVHDLEKPLPIADGSYDHVLLMNVLEHIFEYRALLQEAVRVLRPGGSIVLTVPLLYPFHASPGDYHRFTATMLEKELEKEGFVDIHIQSLGSGVFAARYLLLDRLIPRPLRVVNFYSCRYVVQALDRGVEGLSRFLGKKYDKADYALGHCVVAHKK